MSSRDRIISALIAKIGFEQHSADYRSTEQDDAGVMAKFFASESGTTFLDGVDFSLMSDATGGASEVYHYAADERQHGGAGEMRAVISEGAPTDEDAFQSDAVAPLAPSGEFLTSDAGTDDNAVASYAETSNYDLDIGTPDAASNQAQQSLSKAPAANSAGANVANVTVGQTDGPMQAITNNFTTLRRDAFELEWAGAEGKTFDPVTPTPDPTPTDPEPNPTPPTPPVQNVDSSDGGSVATTSTASGNYSVSGGRVTTLEVDNLDSVASIRIIDGPTHGNLTINPDNTMALVMSMENDFSGSMTMRYEVTYEDGSSQVFGDTVSVARSAQDAGWGHGDHYMLETDADGQLIIETGENHRSVYISGDSDALSRADIAALEGLSTSQITDEWLANNAEYGANEATALNLEAGMGVWNTITGSGADPSSHWLLFENGHEYAADLASVGVAGEDPLHPIHITSYGDGERAIITQRAFAIGDSLQNVVFSDLKFHDGFTALDSSNVILDHVEISDDNETALIVQSLSGISENFTIRNSSIVDAYYTTPPDGSGTWAANPYMAGAYIDSTHGVLIEGNLFDHNGWAPDYREDLSAQGGQPPQMFNHNLYLQWNTTDVTLSDNIIMRGASFGAQARGGAFIEDNLFLDNNIGFTTAGGDHDGRGPVGNFSLAADNVITSAGSRSADQASAGAVASGIRGNNGEQTSLVDNIITHLADPNNPDEQADKDYSTGAHLNFKDPYYDDTIVHNWNGSAPDSDQNLTGVNTDDLDTIVLDATTIQTFTQQLLGDRNAGIPELANYLRAQAEGRFDNVVDADLIIAYFQAGFGLSVEGRIGAETLRFVPDALGDGIRWDNRLNWDTDDLPGTVAGDSVDLAGNWVTYGGNTVIANLDFGNGGTLSVTNGRLAVTGQTEADGNTSTLNITNSGQIWLDGYAGQAELNINADGGRFANTGIFNGATDVDITDGQFILATAGADFVLRDGSELTIVGDDARVGFDGANGDTAVLVMDDNATLTFDAEGGALGTIEEFSSGALGGSPNVQSGVNLGDSTLSLDLAGWSGSSETLISVDELIGSFGELDVTGLAGNQDAEILINYNNDTVTLNVSSGSGQSTIRTIGDETDAQGNDDLWTALNDGHGIYDIA